jgi:hypothetical protein
MNVADFGISTELCKIAVLLPQFDKIKRPTWYRMHVQFSANHSEGTQHTCLARLDFWEIRDAVNTVYHRTCVSEHACRALASSASLAPS